MSKFRAAVIAVTLAVLFFVPTTVMAKEETAQKEETEPKKTEEIFEEPKPEEPELEEQEQFFRIYDMETEEIKNVTYSDYVKGAVAAEMGASFEEEALAAQGVAAFSYALYHKELHSAADYDFSAAPEKKLGYMTEEKAKEVYGKDFEESWNKISRAAEKAMEYVLCYDKKPALSVYHAISAGKTESCENAWGAFVEYLVPVESPGDVLHKDYETTVIVEEKDALERLNPNGAKLNGKKPQKWFEGAKLTESGYVDYIEIGAATFSGEKLRNLFGLRSAAFTVEYKKGEFIFTVHGYGHGVGLSQIGANEMAKNGAAFEEILAHYYPGTELLEYGEVYG